MLQQRGGWPETERGGSRRWTSDREPRSCLRGRAKPEALWRLEVGIANVVTGAGARDARRDEWRVLHDAKLLARFELSGNACAVTAVRMHSDEVSVGVELVARLIAEQYPCWSDLALRRVEPWGTDNAIWRLGEDLVVRLPRIAWAKEQPAKEAKWLPVLASHLPVAVPEPVALGRSDSEYPFTWSVHRWLPGELASPSTIGDRNAFADAMIGVIHGLGKAPTDGAPAPHNRARALAEYDESAREAISSAADLIDADVALELWEAGLAAEPYSGCLRWVHGDLEGNCLVLDGHLSGVIDWGSACIGDPAVDVQVAWSPLFTDKSRARFLERLGPSHATIERAKAMAIQQACAALPYYLHTYPLIVERSWHKLAALGVPVKVERF